MSADRWTEETYKERKPLNIAIVGYTDSRHDAPFGDPDWQVWGLNNLHVQSTPEQLKGFTRWYDLHDAKSIVSDPVHATWLTQTELPVYVWNVNSDWPSSVAYPRDEIIEEFGRYFTNSVSWMIAHAILEGATSIGIYGVDMAQSGEYSAQRPSCEYFLGLAAGLGIELIIAETSDLLKTTSLYGDSDSGFRAKLEQRSHELRLRIGQIEAEVDRLSAARYQMIGALESNDYILGVWTMPSANREAKVSGDPNLPLLTT